ncbi:hypothetical protein N7E81_00170 [Reichenbachiella carrageenanivorans]|uniref:Lipoprotein n=1 Tax=Reichenbachiella carrageenanivorans TaxID=2979869 RepID=A0ABY6D034_9BACT|nr:hypothetical protein [Reichenbachiella carrageenanivorans]UXX79525.1 hypothetical protein N7E81_00170 [Reichenbachiella carrageenanivorans]
MKFLKNLSLIAAAMCFLFVAGCGAKSTSTESEETVVEETTEAVEEVTEEATEMADEAMESIDSLATEAVDSVASEN